MDKQAFFGVFVATYLSSWAAGLTEDQAVTLLAKAVPVAVRLATASWQAMQDQADFVAPDGTPYFTT
jgi:hypothetical protein